MDYPYQCAPEEVTYSDQLPLDPAAKKAFFQDIAEQVFALASSGGDDPPVPPRAFGL